MTIPVRNQMSAGLILLVFRKWLTIGESQADCSMSETDSTWSGASGLISVFDSDDSMSLSI